jgi:hypothetical protein
MPGRTHSIHLKAEGCNTLAPVVVSNLLREFAGLHIQCLQCANSPAMIFSVTDLGYANLCTGQL